MYQRRSDGIQGDPARESDIPLLPGHVVQWYWY
jgi:hypothetical protein